MYYIEWYVHDRQGFRWQRKTSLGSHSTLLEALDAALASTTDYWRIKQGGKVIVRGPLGPNNR